MWFACLFLACFSNSFHLWQAQVTHFFYVFNLIFVMYKKTKSNKTSYASFDYKLKRSVVLMIHGSWFFAIYETKKIRIQLFVLTVRFSPSLLRFLIKWFRCTTDVKDEVYLVSIMLSNGDRTNEHSLSVEQDPNICRWGKYLSWK